ncbi:M23 family metallopeptidase [Pseudarthrobacter sp. J1763]|uniref:M23 family metallopeptidase n=1 Tax=Pseudarthrobacter sp. J1763 TaxID=3420445 RepID=UPI003D2B671E
MTIENARGRRRATAPAVPTAPSALDAAPRQVRRHAATRKSALRQFADLATATGVAQKAGLVLGAAGLALAVSFPTTSGPLAAESMGSAAPAAAVVAAPQVAVTADSGAKISFSRSTVTSTVDPDARLKQLLGAQSAGKITPAAAKGSLGAPLDTLVQASPFGYRVNPITGGMGEFHRGQDFVAQCGTAVHAAASGKVTFAGWHPYGGGNRVVIDHGNGLETTYNHLSSISVTVGQQLTRGEVLALSGTTGASTGCHLHFEVMVNGDVVDPEGWL